MALPAMSAAEGRPRRGAGEVALLTDDEAKTLRDRRQGVLTRYGAGVSDVAAPREMLGVFPQAAREGLVYSITSLFDR